MSDVEVTHAENQTRADTARALSALAEALAGDGKVELVLGPTRMSVRVPDELRCKVEVEIDRDEVEFEIELRWSTAPREKSEPQDDGHDVDTAETVGAAEPVRASSRRKAEAR